MSRTAGSMGGGVAGLAAAAALLVVMAAPVRAQYTITTRDTGLDGDNFQTHNQKVVYLTGGVIFTSGHTTTNQIVRRSGDGGVTWTTVLNEPLTGTVKAASIETDNSGNVYAIFPDDGGNTTEFRKFNSAGQLQVSRSYSGASSTSKFSSCYDPVRNRLYHATQGGGLVTYDTNGNVLSNRQIFTVGSTAKPQYPTLVVDQEGVLHYGQTTVGSADENDGVGYETIRYVKSADGGSNWTTMAGTAINLAANDCDYNGPSTMITTPTEADYNTWLANMHVVNGKAHFTYKTRNPANPSLLPNPPPVIATYQVYSRFNASTGAKEISTQNSLQGETLEIDSIGASFTSDAHDPTSPLFVVGGNGIGGSSSGELDGNRFVILTSFDNGRTWHDHAQSDLYSAHKNTSFFRETTADGKIVGTMAAFSSQTQIQYFSASTGYQYFDAGSTTGGGIQGGSGSAGGGNFALDHRQTLARVNRTQGDSVLFKADSTKTYTYATSNNQAYRHWVVDNANVVTADFTSSGTQTFTGDIMVQSASTLQWNTANSAIAGSPSIVVNDGSTMRFTSDSTTDRTFTAAKVDLGDGNNRFETTNGTAALTIWTNEIDGNSGDIISLGNTTHLRLYAYWSQTYDGQLQGSGDFSKDGAGTVTLTANNSIAGTTTVSGGVLNVGSGGGSATTGGVAGPIAIGTSGTFVYNRANDATLGNAISGSGLFRKWGAGQVALTGNNAFSGTIDVRDGKIALVDPNSEDGVPAVSVSAGASLSLGDAFNGGTATIGVLSGGGTVDGGWGTTAGTRRLSIDQSSAATFSGAINDGSSGRVIAISKAGAGDLNLTGTTSSYSGGTTIAAGRLRIVSDDSLGAAGGDITFAAGGSGLLMNYDSVVSLNSGRWVNLTGNGTIQAGWTKDIAVAGRITGAGGLTIKSDANPGWVIFTNSGNDYTGTTTVESNANLRFSGGANRIRSGNDMVVNGTLDMNNCATTLNALSGSGAIATGGATLTVGSGGASSSFAGVISEGGGLVKAGSGTFTVTGGNTFTGATAVTVSGGSLAVNGNATVRQATLSGGNVTGSAVLTVSNLGGIGIEATANATVSARVELGSTGTASGNNLDFGADTGTTLSFNGVISSAAGHGIDIYKGAQNGWVAFNAANTYAGPTSIHNGSVRLGVTNAIKSGNDVWIGGGRVLDLNGFAQTLDNLTGSGTVTTGGGTLTVGSGGSSFTYGGVITEAGGLVKAGTGVATLTGASIYTGATTVSGGTLTIGPGGSVNSASLLSVARGATVNFSQNAYNAFGATQQSGTWSIAGTLRATTAQPNTMVANVALTSGTIDSTGGAPANYGAFYFNGRTITANGVGNVISGNGRVGIDGTVTLATPLVGDVLSVSAQLGSGGANANAGGITKTGLGTVTLSGANTYTGATTVSGGVLALGAANRLADATAVTVAGGGLNLGGFSDTVASLTVSSGSVFGGGTLTASTYTLAGGTTAVNLGGGVLRVTGNALLTGTAGATAVNLDAGSLTLASGGRLNAAAAVSGSAGAALTLGGDETIGSLAGAVGMAFRGHRLTVGGTAATTYAGLISGSGGLTKSGAGSLRLAGAANSFSGDVVVTAGSLELTAGTLGGVNALTVSGGVVSVLGANTIRQVTLGGGAVAGTADLALSNGGAAGIQATATGTVACPVELGSQADGGNNLDLGADTGATLNINGVIGSVAGYGVDIHRVGQNGWVVFNAANTYTGATTIASGNLRLGVDHAIRSGNDVSVGPGRVLDLGGCRQAFGSLTGSGTVTTGGAVLTIGADGSSFTFDGVVTGSGGITKSGTGTAVLTGASSYTGPTLVAAGMLRSANATAFDASDVTVADGGILALDPGMQATVAGLSVAGLVDISTGLVTVRSGLSSAELKAALISGRGDGAWNGGTGITSSAVAAAAGRRAVGWLDNGDGSLSFGYAAQGDTDLSGIVDISDLSNLIAAGKYDTGEAASWAEGDFNYDGMVDMLDIVDMIASNVYGQGDYRPGADSVAAVPEPKVWPFVAAGLLFRVARRFRRPVW